MATPKYASRAGDKLAYALEHFQVDVRDKVAVDLGASTGGFTDVLLRRGAKRVYAVDTAYGQLDWKLRQDSRVIVRERTNALRLSLPEEADMVTIDVGWTRQLLVIPKALEWLRPGGEIISLLKPHYEAGRYGIHYQGGRLTTEQREKVKEALADELANRGIAIRGIVESPICGAKGQNREYLLHIIK